MKNKTDCKPRSSFFMLAALLLLASTLLPFAYSATESPPQGIVPIWIRTWQVALGAPTVEGNFIYAGVTTNFVNGTVTCYSALSGENIWSPPTVGFVGTAPVVIDGVVYAGDNQGYVYAFGATYGDLRWTTYTGGFADNPVVAGGRVFVRYGSISSGLCALDAQNGRKLWNFTASNTLGIPTAVGDRVYFSSNNGVVYGVNVSTGEMLWSAFVNSTGGSVQVVGDFVYTIGQSNTNVESNDVVFAINATTGTTVWNFATGGSIGPMFKASDGKVYACMNSYGIGVFIILDALTGFKLLSYNNIEGTVQSAPFPNNDKVYLSSQHVSSSDANGITGTSLVYAFSSQSRNLLWIQNWDVTPVNDWFSITASGNAVCVITRDGNITAFDSATGAKTGSYLTAGYGPLAVSSSGFLYVFSGSKPTTMYDFRIPGISPLPSSSPPVTITSPPTPTPTLPPATPTPATPSPTTSPPTPKPSIPTASPSPSPTFYIPQSSGSTQSPSNVLPIVIIVIAIVVIGIVFFIAAVMMRKRNILFKK